jgi:hypothetical protein
MSKPTQLMSPRKVLACGGAPEGYANGGRVKLGSPYRKGTGTPDSPLEAIKRANGIPGMQKGGSVKC